MNKIKLKLKHNIFNMKEGVQTSDSEILDMKENYELILSIMKKQGIVEARVMIQYLNIIGGKDT